MRLISSVLGTLLSFSVSSVALAEVSVRALSGVALPDGLASASLSAVVRAPQSGPLPTGAGVLPIARGFGVVRAPLAELERLAAAHPEWDVTWTLPRRLLIDRAAERVGAVQVRNDSGLTGQGVAVGIVDTGLDFTHPDFQNADGTTRVEWFVDLQAPAVGVHPGIEALCEDAGFSCAVYGRAELDERLASGDPIPGDDLGHGTHVASIAAGNGSAGASGRFAGVAPEASLVVARGLAAALSIDDVDVLSAVEILYFLVEQYGPSLGRPRMPMVMNLSLGSDFGPHDGTSVLGQGLAALVADDHPGRAIVVAVGNSATLFTGFEAFPEPLGVHTNVHVFDASTRVPLVVPRVHGEPRTEGEVLAWIEMTPGDELAVGVEGRDGTLLSPVPFGGSRAATDGDVQVTVVNGTRQDLPVLPETRPAAVVLIEGDWPSTETLALRLEGSGTAEVWVQAAGALDPLRGGAGVLVPAATKEGTVNIPAVHPELISVGATLNRIEWTDRQGDTIEVSGAVRGGLGVGAPAIFSSAGPNVDGFVRPDLVAPGGYVVAALSDRADPTENPFSIFHQAAFCAPSPECALVGDAYAVGAGTSMAAPLAAGAVALLLERDPDLTQRAIRGILRGSARSVGPDVRVDQQLGAGELDVIAALDALDERVAPSGRTPSDASRIVVGRSYAVPDPADVLRGLLVLRDQDDRLAEGFDEAELRLRAEPSTAEPELVAEGPGLRSFAVRLPAGTGGGSLELSLRYAGREIARSRLPIAVDSSVAAHGLFASGGCAVAPAFRRPGLAPITALAASACLAWRGRRRRRGARVAHSRGRRGSSG